MRLMILGASLGQLVAIKKAKENGHYVVTCDYYENAPGHAISDEQYIVSTFDVAGIAKVAEEAKIDGIMTVGTDQPVYTAAVVSERLGLPTLIDSKTALCATNKVAMKTHLTSAGIPMVPYMLYEPGMIIEPFFNGRDVVIKPVDTQGQRGIFFLQDVSETKLYYEQVIIHSRQKQILIEAYYEHDEVTVSGWVHQGVPYILAVTDRVTFDDKRRIGICLSHEFPSKHLHLHYAEISRLTKNIVEALNVQDGPIYFQMFIGVDGIKVNEIACRIGGAFEGEYLPNLTGIDMCDMQIKSALGLPLSAEQIETLQNYDIMRNCRYLSVQLFFAQPCRIHHLTDETQVMALEGVVKLGYHKSEGDVIETIDNATARVGYCIVEANNKQQLEERLSGLYTVLKVRDEAGKNQIIHRTLEATNGD